MQKTVFLGLCLTGIMLTGCAQLGVPTPWQSPQPPAGTDQAPEAGPADRPASTAAADAEDEAPSDNGEVEYASFDPETLFELMVAELAAQRGRYDVTLVNYVNAARRTRDPAVLRRAMGVARGLDADNAQYQLAQSWLQVEPNNINALRVAAVQAIKHKDFEDAFPIIDRILAMGKSPEFDNLGPYARNLPEEDKQRLVSLFEKLAAAYPGNTEITQNLAMLYAAQGNNGKALATLEPLLEAHPGLSDAKALKASLLFESGQKAQALEYLEDQTEAYPDDLQLGTLYARMLVENEQVAEAEAVFGRLTRRHPDNSRVRLSYALVALENENLEIAKRELEKLLEDKRHVHDAHFYLGRISRQRGKTEAALDHFREVTRGGHLFSALSNRAEILLEAGKVDKARELLAKARTAAPSQAPRFWLIEINTLSDAGYKKAAESAASSALQEFPENTTLRYARAMIRDELGDLKGAERDFRQIIELEPENAVALNALGYTLTVRTDRYAEALKFIRKAHELAPDNPAIIDSLGWVHYKLGNTAKALEYLEQAYEVFPDPEVAAHLGEVLWTQGQKERARQVWGEGMETAPDNTHIPETLQRLGIDPETL